MIVIAVLGILAALAIPNFASYMERAKIARAQSDLDMIAQAILLYEIDTGRWPGNQDPAVVKGLLAAGGTFPANNEVSDLTPYLVPNYLPSMPKDPWGNNYFFDTDYTTLDGRRHVVVGSGGPNKSGINVYDADNVIKIIY